MLVCYKLLSRCAIRGIATVAFKLLSVELAFPVSRHLEIFDATGSSDQIRGVGAVVVPSTLGTAFSPAHNGLWLPLIITQLARWHREMALHRELHNNTGDAPKTVPCIVFY